MADFNQPQMDGWEAFLQYARRGLCDDRGRLCTSNPKYVLGRIRGEALALLAMCPEDGPAINRACVIIGYVELFDHYEAGEFPWGHVVERLIDMRKQVVAAGDIRTRFCRARRQIGTQRKVAEALGKSESFVSKRELGCVRVTTRDLFSLWSLRGR